MSSFQLESTQDVWVSDKIANVGVNQHCALTHMLKPLFSISHHIGLENIYTKMKAHANEQGFFFFCKLK